ncbi:MAG: hypothetical protein QXH91_08680 [Candidatus Bathyarchaeia archaeon]
MSFYRPEEYELLRLARILGGVSKIKELLQVMKDKNITVDALLAYLKSTGYKLPSSLEGKIEELEKRIIILEGGKLPTPQVSPPPPPPVSIPQLKEWRDEELNEYLDDCQKGYEFTFLYYKILTEIDGKISRADLIKKIGELSHKKFTRYSLAGVQSGIARYVTNHNYERLDWKDENSQYFSLNEKYREKMRNYFIRCMSSQ